MDNKGENLKLLCFPSLGALLGISQNKKGSVLTPTEVEEIATNAPCVALEEEQYWKMLDMQEEMHVDPENAWDDWQRAMPDYGFGYLPMIALKIPGDEQFKKKASEFLEENSDLAFEFLDRDNNFAQDCHTYSFKNEHSFSEEDLALIETHTCILLCSNKGAVSNRTHRVAAHFLKLGNELLDLGGMAVAVETSSLYHSKTNWKSLVEFCEDKKIDESKYWGGLFSAYVQLPLSSDKDCFSCGMHLLGKPDMVASFSALNQAYPDLAPQTAGYRLYHEMGFYLLNEGQRKPIGSGHTFQMNLESPIFQITWEPCSLVPEGTTLFNPYGLWRFEPVSARESESILQKLGRFFKK